MQIVKILEIAVTNKCNLGCSFCGGESYMKDGGEVGRKTLTDSTLAAIKEHPELDEMLWIGGEPLLAINKIEHMLPLVKTANPNIRHDFMTNGLKLKIANVELLSQFERVTVSIDGFKKSERPLMAFMESGNCEALEAMSMLCNKRTWAVITREQLADPRWYEDIIDLHNAIYHLNWVNMSLTFDTNMSKELSPDHILNFIWGYKRIRDNILRLNKCNEQFTAHDVEKMFTHEKCFRCSQTLLVKADGKRNEHVDVVSNSELVYGCNKIAKIIGTDAYRYIQKFLNPEYKL